MSLQEDSKTTPFVPDPALSSLSHSRIGSHFSPSDGPTPQDEIPGRGGSGRAPKVAAAVVAGLAAVYLGGVAVWSNVFMPNTSVNGVDVSLETPASVARQQTVATSSYALAVSGEGLDLKVSASDVDLSCDVDAFARDALAQTNAWAWPVAAIRGSKVDVRPQASFDASKLDGLVGKAVDAVNAHATQPVNASVGYDPTSSGFVVSPEKAGTALDAASVTKAVGSALKEGATSLALDESALTQPSILSGDGRLAEAVKTANSYLAATQTLTVDGNAVATVDAGRIAEWVHVQDDLSVTLDDEAIKAWTTGELSRQLDTVGTTRTYTRPDGVTIKVSGGRYGWNLNGTELAETLAQNVRAGSATSVELPWSSTAAQYGKRGAADWGDRYIDVDLTNQHARMYDGGSLVWESDFVSGNTSQDHGTPEGVYSVNSHMGTNQTLKGIDEDHDGEPDYVSHVSYWVPFIDNLYAFHDASWRSRFGGSIYQTDGSHGCINLPSAKAEELYDLAKVGDVVVVHY